MYPWLRTSSIEPAQTHTAGGGMPAGKGEWLECLHCADLSTQNLAAICSQFKFIPSKDLMYRGLSECKLNFVTFAHTWACMRAHTQYLEFSWSFAEDMATELPIRKCKQLLVCFSNETGCFFQYFVCTICMIIYYGMTTF